MEILVEECTWYVKPNTLTKANTVTHIFIHTKSTHSCTLLLMLISVVGTNMCQQFLLDLNIPYFFIVVVIKTL